MIRRLLATAGWLLVQLSEMRIEAPDNVRAFELGREVGRADRAPTPTPVEQADAQIFRLPDPETMAAARRISARLSGPA